MLTLKQERFVQELVKGKSQREAYKLSYDASRMKDATIDKRASELFRKGEIKGRYDELTKASRSKTSDDAESIRAFIMETYKKIASGEMCDTTTEYDKDGNVIRVRKTIKQSDVITATDKLAAYYGVAPEEKETNEIQVVLKGLEEYAD